MNRTQFFKALLAIIPVWALTEQTAQSLRFFGATVILYILTMLFAGLFERIKNKTLLEAILCFWILLTTSLGHYFFGWDPRMLISLLFLLPISLEKQSGASQQLFLFKKQTISSITTQAFFFLGLFAFFAFVQVMFSKGYFLWLNHAGGFFVFAAIAAWSAQWASLLKAQREEGVHE